MPGKLTLYPSEGVSRHFVIGEDRSHRIGRDPSSDILLEDPRVSAVHAVIRRSGSEWLLADSGSKNGTFVNAARIIEASVRDGDWLSLGGLLARFELVSEEQVANLGRERERRVQTFSEARRILEANREPGTLLVKLLDSVLELTGAERGCLLLFTPEGGLSAEVVSGFAGAGPLDDRFNGSFGAIERALSTGRSVVTADARADAYLGGRRSVLELGIEALACVPLKAEEKAVGLIYVDGRKRGGTFTDLDLETLEALADYAAVTAGSLHLDRQIRQLVGAVPSGSSAAGPTFLEDFERRIREITGCPAARLSSP
jgi:pSer/pThr/pTyr-binding forkhead associated (FHA) protein